MNSHLNAAGTLQAARANNALFYNQLKKTPVSK